MVKEVLPTDDVLTLFFLTAINFCVLMAAI